VKQPKQKTENPKPTKARLDNLLVSRGLADTRARAQALILAGRVKVHGVPVTKAGTLVPEDAALELLAPASPYVSRGGEKLVAALDHFEVEQTEDVRLVAEFIRSSERGIVK